MTFTERHSLEEFSLKIHAITIGLILSGILFFAVIHYMYLDVNIWESWEGGKSDRTIHRAERVYPDSIVKTRANTWSNYAFIIVGIYALVFTFLDKKAERDSSKAFIVQNPLFGLFFGLGCVYLGLASGLWHASLTRMGARLDVASMYAGMVALIMMNLYRLIPRIPGTQINSNLIFAILIILVNINLFIFKYHLPLMGTMAVFILTMAILTVLDLFRKNSHFLRYWPLLCMIFLIIGITCRQADVSDYISIHPDTIFQGHALWHVLCAFTLGCIYMYYRSEKITSD